ncbi:hypothetical protein OG607_27510 [Streptomyces sp. NBC_01537]|uniref:hypothetical protein n=1 Tax=Streptomyces sp. NBC_01537 TaxID=2903896 RepID=UPI00386C1CB1
MDEGKATLIVGGVGLLGVIVSTVGAWLASRHGANKAVEAAKVQLDAARVQVSAQRSADWGHWERERRSQTLLDMLDQVAAIDSTLRTAGVKLILGETPTNALHEQFMTASNALLRDVFHLGVWGPDQARVNGRNIIALTHRIYDAWARWEGAVISGNLTGEHSEAFQEGRRDLQGQWGQLIDAAKQSLRAPEEGGS